MGSIINVTSSSYAEETAAENWAGEYIKRELERHKAEEVLDHPDGCVTEKKLSGEVVEKITNAQMLANNALAEAQSALSYATTVLEGMINEAQIDVISIKNLCEEISQKITSLDKIVNTHVNDYDSHITNSNRLEWNAATMIAQYAQETADNAMAGIEEISSDIETALDSIIVIQNSLIGGGNK